MFRTVVAAVANGAIWRLGAIWIGVGLVGLAGCTAPIVSVKPKTYAITPRDYQTVYERWTRDASPFDFGRLSTVMHVTATFESREFRWGYVVRYGEDFGLAIDARNAMLSATLADAERHHRFLVTLGGAPFRHLDLTTERSAWRVLLLDDRGRQVRPVEIEHIERPTSAERAYFPSVGPLRQAFRLVFPVMHEDGHPTVPPQATFAVLRFTGPEGQVDLKWKFAAD